jgi:pimeloyl-ACP methyl ester carboxylesterase
MLRLAALVLALCSIVGPVPLRSQAVDTARVRAAYAAVTALRNDYERSHGRFVTVNGIRMHYLEWGDARGVPLVWAHGSGSSGYEIRAVAPRLAEAGYRVLAVDYRGHGQTRVTNYDFFIDDIADDLVALLDSLKIAAAVFGGGSKGGVVAAAVYDQYPNRVLGLLMADGGTASQQWIFDHASAEQLNRMLSDPIPTITGPSEFDVFRRVVGNNIKPGGLPTEQLLDMINRIGPTGNGQWAFLPGFDRMMGSYEQWKASFTHPSVLPPLQWSEQAQIPRMIFRNLRVPMMILDPQSERDYRPSTDQNEQLVKDHPGLVINRIYPESEHNILRQRPDWFVRDAVALLGEVRKRQGSK